MAATRTILTGGAGTGNWSTTGNWDNGKPASTDYAYIPPSLSYNVTMTGDETAVDCYLIEVHRDYRGTVGTSGSPIQISTDVLKVFGSTGFYMEATDGQLGHTLIQCPDANTPVQLGTESGGGDGEWDRIMLDRGKLTVAAGLLWDDAGGELVTTGSQATAILTTGGDTLPSLYMNGGSVYSDVAITAAHLAGGTLYQDTALATTVHVFEGATYVLNHTAATNVIIHTGGTLDMMQNSDFKTITNLYTYRGSRLIWDPEWDATPPSPVYGLHTVTNWYDYRGVG